MLGFFYYTIHSMLYRIFFYCLLAMLVLGSALLFPLEFSETILIQMLVCILGSICIEIIMHISKNDERLFDQALERIGFFPSSNQDNLRGFQLDSEYRLLMKETYSSNTPRPYTLHRFTIMYGRKMKMPCLFLGFVFTMKDSHPTVLICDTRHVIQSALTRRLLESSEFEKAFHVYSNDPKAPFYFLDPDTMSDLIDIHARSPYSIFIDVVDKQLLVAISIGDVHAQLFESLTLREKITGRISDQRAADIAREYEAIVHTAHRVFHSLDYPIRQR